MAVPLVDLCALEVGEGLIRFQRVVNDQHIGPPPGEDAPDGGGQAKPLTSRHKFFDRVFLAREAGPRKQGVKPGTRHHGPAIAHMFVGEFLRIAHTEELPLRRGFLYLVAVLDWYSRYVLAWALSNTLEARFCLEAVDQALASGQPQIFNTDQGAQFTGAAFTGRLKS